MSRLTPKQRDKALAGLTRRAKELYYNIRAGRFYKAYDSQEKTPKAMVELLEAKLVMPGARVVVIGSYFVPHDYKMFKFETWEGKKG